MAVKKVTAYKVSKLSGALAIDRTGSVGEFGQRVRIELRRWWSCANAGNYIAQPTLALSACLTFVGTGIAPRHIDLPPMCSPVRP